MFRKSVDPKIAAVATLVTLGTIQWVYWRNLVHQTSGPALMPPMGGSPAGGPKAALGMDSVLVDNWTGDEPGFADGATWSARFDGPNALADEPDGSLLVADSRNHCLRRISPRGAVSTIAGAATGDGGGAAVGPALSARFRYPSGVAAAKDGVVYLSDTGNHRICRLQGGQVTVVAGGAPGLADGAGAAARFNSPAGLALDRAGALWVWDAGNRKLRRVDGAGSVTTPAQAPPEIAATLGMAARSVPEVVSSAAEGTGPVAPSDFRTGTRSGAALLPSGVRVFGDLTYNVVYVQREGEGPVLVAGRIIAGTNAIGDRDGKGLRASFATPAAVVARPDGTVFVADYDGNRIRRLRLPTALIQ